MLLPLMNKKLLAKFVSRLNWFVGFYATAVHKILGTTIKSIFVLTATVVVKTTKKNLMPLSMFLKKHSLCCYSQLIELATEDTPNYKNRFRINYIFSSFVYGHKIILSLTAHELQYIPSLVAVFLSAGWLEREV